MQFGEPYRAEAPAAGRGEPAHCLIEGGVLTRLTDRRKLHERTEFHFLFLLAGHLSQRLSSGINLSMSTGADASAGSARQPRKRTGVGIFSSSAPYKQMYFPVPPTEQPA